MQSKLQIGFTAIELMITLAVAAVLMVLAVPSFSTLIEKSRLRGATDDIVNLLNSSRANAVKMQFDVSVAMGGTASAWCAGANSATQPAAGSPVTTAAACNCTTANACQVSGVQALVSSTSYSGNSSSGVTVSDETAAVVFNAKLGALYPLAYTGTLSTTTPLVLTSSSGKFKTQISVSPLGQVTACVPSPSPFVAGYPSC